MCSPPDSGGLRGIKPFSPSSSSSSSGHVALTTPAGGAAFRAWDVELSFSVRLLTYFGILGAVGFVIYVTLKCLEACTEEGAPPAGGASASASATETSPVMAPAGGKELEAGRRTYGATEDDPESGPCCSSSEDLYDGKICVVCYDRRRDCYFTPCGHSAVCLPCAQRLLQEEEKNKAWCPVCRRLIHRVRSLDSTE